MGKSRLQVPENLILVCHRRPAVVEFVYMNARAHGPGINQQRVLDKREARFVRRSAVDGFRWVWIVCRRCGRFECREFAVFCVGVRLRGRWSFLAGALSDIVRRGRVMRVGVGRCDDVVVIVIDRS